MKILLVDDSELAREPMELKLRLLGHEIATADHGGQALALYAPDAFDLVISDIRMPEVDGLELLRRIRQRNPEQDVILVTGYGDVESSIQALRHGAANYLMKPINLEELALAVERVAKKQALDRRFKEQEARLAHASKMADLGVVAAGMAHEINNPNTFVRGNVQTLQKFWEVLTPFLLAAVAAGVASPRQLDFIMAETPKVLTAMLDGTERIRKIVENTALFSRQLDLDVRKPVDVNLCVRKALSALHGEASSVEMIAGLTPDLPLVMAVEEDLVEIAGELLRNSLKAVSERQAPAIRVRTTRPSAFEVWIEVEDNGAGIRPEDQSRIFTPFFSTDHRVGRPGLGLSKVYALSRAMGGDAFFHSRLDQGTCFTVKLPALDERTLA